MDIFGSQNNDLLRGSDGHDLIEGLFGDDTLIGDSGNDLLKGGRGKDWIEGRNGNDTLLGGRGSDRLWGDDGDDLLKGGAHSDELYGDDGNDTLIGGSGNDTLVGGSGFNHYIANKGDTILTGQDKELIEVDGSSGRGETIIDLHAYHRRAWYSGYRPTPGDTIILSNFSAEDVVRIIDVRGVDSIHVNGTKPQIFLEAAPDIMQGSSIGGSVPIFGF